MSTKALPVSSKRKLHFLFLYPLKKAPSQRFRFEQFMPFFSEEGYECSYNSFYDDKTFRILYQKGSKLKLACRVLLCFVKRSMHIFTIGKYDIIFIQRGSAPLGPPVFEWMIRYIYRVPIVYDFDDAIWMNPQKNESKLKRWLKGYSKVNSICRWARFVVVGNNFLASYAKRFSDQVQVIPTVVDTETKFVPYSDHKNSIPVIGWTGSHTTLPYLEVMEPMLLRLKNKCNFDLLVIANSKPGFKTITYNFKQWTEETEASLLDGIDIGIMPLPDTEWTKGKCGFKAIQYMAMKKPAIVSAVGFNTELVEDGKDGFLCTSEDDWENALASLIENPQLAIQMGENARKKAVEHYSVKTAWEKWKAVVARV